MADMKSVLKETTEALKSADDAKKAILATKLSGVLETFVEKLSFFSDIPEHFKETVEPQVEAQVKSIEDKTEHAADAILTACENVGSAIKDAPAEIKSAVQNEINKIFEASNFQDLVAQHANEIRILMKDIKADMSDIQNITGETDGKVNPAERSRNSNKRPDDHLLNGPPTS